MWRGSNPLQGTIFTSTPVTRNSFESQKSIDDVVSSVTTKLRDEFMQEVQEKCGGIPLDEVIEILKKVRPEEFI